MRITARTAAVLTTATMLVGIGGVTAATHASAAALNGPCSSYSTSEPLLAQGSSGAAVKELQCELNLSVDPVDGYSVSIDGSFGPLTRRAVLKFQSCMGIQQDGIVGPATWSYLDWYSNSSYYGC